MEKVYSPSFGAFEFAGEDDAELVLVVVELDLHEIVRRSSPSRCGLSAEKSGSFFQSPRYSCELQTASAPAPARRRVSLPCMVTAWPGKVQTYG